MAQDFYNAFQLDGIGNDTTINTIDIDGISFIAIQALEQRTRDQADEIKKLKAENAQLKMQTGTVAELGERLNALESAWKNIGKTAGK